MAWVLVLTAGAAAAPSVDSRYPRSRDEPASVPSVLPSARTCTSRRRFRIHLRAPHGARLVRAKVYVNGNRTTVTRRAGRLVAAADLRGLRKRRYSVRVVAVTRSGRHIVGERRYRTCEPGRGR